MPSFPSISYFAIRMRITLPGILFLLWSLTLGAQPAGLDSLDKWLGGFPPAIKLDLLESMRDDVERRTNVGERYEFARELMEYGRDRPDTIVWQYGLEWLADAFQANGQADRAAEIRAALRQLSVNFGWPLDIGYTRVKTPFGYRYQLLTHPLAVLQDAAGEFSVQEVRTMAQAGNFTLNDVEGRGFQPEIVYWVKVQLRGPERNGGEYTFLPGSGYGPEGRLFTWDSIRVYADYGPDSLIQLRTGAAYPPSERLVRDAFPFFSVSVAAGQDVTLYLRLQGGSTHPGSRRIFLEMVDRSSLHEYGGYRLPAYSELEFPEGFDTRTRRIARSLEVLIDDTDELAFSDIWGEWEERSFMNDWRIEDWNQIFWVRLRLLGSEEGAGPLLLQLPEEQAWDSVEVYWPNEQHRYVKQWMGRRTPKWQRPLPHWRSLLRLHMNPSDTVDVYFRMRGYAGDRSARQIRLEQIWEDSFWPDQPYAAYVRGLLLGMLLLAFLFTLVLALIRASYTLGWFALFLAGLALLALFGFPEENGALIWPSGAGRYNLIALAGGWLGLLALTRYVIGIFRIPEIASAMARWANLGLVLWTLTVAASLLVMTGVLPGYPLSDILIYLLPFLALLLSLTIVVIAVYALYRGSELAWLVLIAFTFAAIAGVLAFAHFVAYGELTLNNPVLWVSMLAGWMGLIFLFVANTQVGEGGEGVRE